MSVTCAICMCSFEEDEYRDVVAIRCGHTYHRSCLSEWKISSKSMSCPECRSKYTARTLKKLFLNVMPKEQNHTEPSDQLVLQQSVADELKRERDKISAEKQQMEFQLMRSRDETQKFAQQNEELKRSYAVKCQAYSLISVVNDEYLSNNDGLKEENVKLKRQLDRLNKELQEAKAKQLRAAKPFVDLTDDVSDDSDVEIIETECTSKKRRRKDDLLALDTEEASRVSKQQVQQVPQEEDQQQLPQEHQSALNNDTSLDKTECLQDLDQFLLEAM